MNQRKVRPVIQSGREVTVKEISEIKETVDLFPKLCLSALNATICEHLEYSLWRLQTGCLHEALGET